MVLTADILKECLGDDLLDLRLSAETFPGFSTVRFLAGSAVPARADVLYLCLPERLAQLDPAVLSQVCVVTRDDPHTRTLPNRFLLRPDCDYEEAANRLFSLFDLADRYAHKLKNAIIAEHGIQSFFELAREMFPHTLIVMADSAYNLVARTRDRVDNAYLQDILERGFYNKEDLDMMAAAGYFEDERKYDQPILYGADSTISRVPFLVRSFRRAGASVFFVGCYFLEAPPNRFDQLSYTWFTDAVGKYVFRHLQADDILPLRQQMIDDLINSDSRDHAFLMDRCTRLHIPFQGSFRLGLIQGETVNTAKAAQMANQLRVYCSVRHYGIFQHHDTILLLFHDWHKMGIKEYASFDEDWQALIRTLRSNQVHLGISLSFTSIDHFSDAYRQASQALLQGQAYGKEGECAHFYSTYYLHDMLSIYDAFIPLESSYMRYLDALQEEKGSSLSNLVLLYVYLASERNVALTARRVHMHRNGVLYRIDKIRDILGLDFDSSDVRLRLLLSFKILEHLGRIRLDEFLEDEPSGSVASIE